MPQLGPTFGDPSERRGPLPPLSPPDSWKAEYRFCARGLTFVVMRDFMPATN